MLSVPRKTILMVVIVFLATGHSVCLWSNSQSPLSNFRHFLVKQLSFRARDTTVPKQTPFITSKRLCLASFKSGVLTQEWKVSTWRYNLIWKSNSYIKIEYCRPAEVQNKCISSSKKINIYSAVLVGVFIYKGKQSGSKVKRLFFSLPFQYELLYVYIIVH